MEGTCAAEARGARRTDLRQRCFGRGHRGVAPHRARPTAYWRGLTAPWSLWQDSCTDPGAVRVLVLHGNAFQSLRPLRSFQQCAAAKRPCLLRVSMSFRPQRVSPCAAPGSASSTFQATSCAFVAPRAAYPRTRGSPSPPPAAQSLSRDEFSAMPALEVLDATSNRWVPADRGHGRHWLTARTRRAASHPLVGWAPRGASGSFASASTA